jgi:hypothetical protein
MGVNGLMQFLRKKIPGVFTTQPKQIKGIAYVDTPLLTMSCGMVAQASHATVDPYALVKQKIINLEQLLLDRGASKVIFVFDGPTRKEKLNTCLKRSENIKKQSEKRKREHEETNLKIYRMEDEDESPETSTPVKFDSPKHVYEEDTPMELFHDEPSAAKIYNAQNHIFPDVTEDHCLESDLYISSMIVHGADTHVLKDLSRYAKRYLGEKAFTAPHDSESYIASVVKHGDVGVTCDSDALPFGCKTVVQNIGTVKETWINLDDVLAALDMSLLEFRTFCVLLGTDFNERLFFCGPTKSFPVIANKNFQGFRHFCETHGKKYSKEERESWIKSADDSLKVFSSEI